MLHEKEKEKILSLRANGLSYGSIANLYNLSRARIHQIISGYKPDKNSKIRKLHENIKARDGFKCQWGERCNGLNQNLIVHHIDFNDRNNEPNNLITLCNLCHCYFHARFHIDDNKERSNSIKACPECKKEFRGNKKQKYCSVKCKSNAKYKEIMELRNKKITFREIGTILHRHPNTIMGFLKRHKQ